MRTPLSGWASSARIMVSAASPPPTIAVRRSRRPLRVKLDTTKERASRSARIVPRPSANQLASHTREELSPILRRNAAASATRNQEPARDDPHAEIEEGPERADAIGSAGLKHRDRQGRQADDGDPVAPVKRNFAGQIEGVDEESRQRDENELHPADH